MRTQLTLNHTALVLLLTSLLIGSCAKKDDSTTTSTSTTSTSESFSVSEITQTLGSDRFLTGSFVVPGNGVSFLLSVFMDNNSATGLTSLTDPDGNNILSISTTPNLVGFASYLAYGHANVLVPQTPRFSAKSGTWSFKAYSNDRVTLGLRTGSTPSAATIVVQPYITGTTWTAENISAALSVMSDIYSKNGITLAVNRTITISGSQYDTVSYNFKNSRTSTLLSQGSTDAVNLFFVQDQSSRETAVLGVAAGIPGSMGSTNSWNGVLNFLTAHAIGTTLNTQLLGETAAHEIGHQLGLFHTTESAGTLFDPLTDTAECTISRDSDSDGKVFAEECDGYGADNVMFWVSWTSTSQTAGKKQETFSNHQVNVLKYSPIAK